MPRGGVAASSQHALILLALALLVAPALADGVSESGTRFDKRIERLVATPTPFGPLLILGDAAVWRVDVPVSAVVIVEAEGAAHSPFYLRAERAGSAASTFFVPTTHAGMILSTPGAWRVSVDPAGGAAVDIHVRFMGQAGGSGGAPHAFTLTTLANENPCLFPSVCLP